MATGGALELSQGPLPMRPTLAAQALGGVGSEDWPTLGRLSPAWHHFP